MVARLSAKRLPTKRKSKKCGNICNKLRRLERKSIETAVQYDDEVTELTFASLSIVDHKRKQQPIQTYYYADDIRRDDHPVHNVLNQNVLNRNNHNVINQNVINQNVLNQNVLNHNVLNNHSELSGHLDLNELDIEVVDENYWSEVLGSEAA